MWWISLFQAQNFYSSRDHKASLTQHGTLPEGFSTSSVDVDFSPEEVPHLKCQMRQTVRSKCFFLAFSIWLFHNFKFLNFSTVSGSWIYLHWPIVAVVSVCLAVDSAGCANSQLRGCVHEEHVPGSPCQDRQKETGRGNGSGTKAI